MSNRYGKAARRVALAGLGVLAAAVGLSPATAGADPLPSLIISEVAPWGSGNTSYAADWFEVTNTGSSAVDITGWKVDDNSHSFATAIALSNVTSIGPGQSVIFIEGSSATADAFKTAWFGGSVPSGFTIGWYSGSGIGLSTTGDEVNLWDSAGTLVTGVAFGGSTTSSPFRSFDNTVGAGSSTLPFPTISTLSSDGVNGAFVAPDATASFSQTGSPGTASPSSPGGTTTTTSTTTTSTVPAPSYLPWPGSQDVNTVDQASSFTGNLSGLDYEGTGGTTPGVLWGVVNSPGLLERLVFDGTNWVPDPANGWGAGKTLRYPGGVGDPDSEGVMFVGDSAGGGIYVGTERNNAASSTSRNAILRFDPSAPGTELTATHEWNLTADLPANGANLGIEGLTWIDDSVLVAKGFVDASKGHAYNPAEYPNHGSGLFFVGIEATGSIYAYALNHSDSTFTRIATFSSGFTQVMELQYDRDLGELWAVCDNGCNGRAHVLRIDPGTGTFGVAARFERPANMPNTNNEGFAIAPATYCVDGFKPAFWADDADLNGFSLRTGTVSCTATEAPGAVVSEFSSAALPVALLVAALGGFAALLERRRRGVV